MIIRICTRLALVTVLGFSGTAQAALQGRDLDGNSATFEAYYDTDLNITWLANANVNGIMNWADATSWAAGLSLTDGVNVYDNWRLPTTLQPDASCGTQSGGVSFGYNCIGSEMGHLFYAELGGTAGQSILTSADPDLAKFTNLQVDRGYWSGTEYSPSSSSTAWLTYFITGYQNFGGKGIGVYALAVSPGDVGAVPEADTWTMLLAGLGLVGFMARHRKQAEA